MPCSLKNNINEKHNFTNLRNAMSLHCAVFLRDLPTVFWERDACYRSLVSLEVGNICSFLQIPDFDDGIICSSPKDKTIRMELSTCQGRSYSHIEKKSIKNFTIGWINSEYLNRKQQKCLKWYIYIYIYKIKN